MTESGDGLGYWRARGRHWDEAADAVAEITGRLNAPLIEAADIQPGHHVLDLASGAGEPALTIAEAVGPAGRVVATDAVPEMLAGARRRGQDRGLSNIAFEVASMEQVPFDDAAFDRVICRFGIMFCDDPGRALAESARVLRSGGRAAFMVWGPRDDTTQFRVFEAVGRALFGAETGMDLETPFRFGAAGALAALMDDAGFHDSEEIELRFEPSVPAHLPFWRNQIGMHFGPLIEAAEDPGAAAAELDARLEAAFGRFVHDGRYQLRLHARIAVGRTP